MPVLSASLAFCFNGFNDLFPPDKGVAQICAQERLSFHGSIGFKFKAGRIPLEIKGMIAGRRFLKQSHLHSMLFSFLVFIFPALAKAIAGKIKTFLIV
jgi:hypothetical protein